MKDLNFERKIPAPDEIHSGIQFNEYTPEGRTMTAKDVILATLAVLVLFFAYCIVGSLEG